MTLDKIALRANMVAALKGLSANDLKDSQARMSAYRGLSASDGDLIALDRDAAHVEAIRRLLYAVK